MQHNPLSLLGIVNLVHTCEGTPHLVHRHKSNENYKGFFQKIFMILLIIKLRVDLFPL
jgi:hypothetical protein